MTVTEAIEKMQATVEASKAKLEGYGFKMSVEPEYLNFSFNPVVDIAKAKYLTVSLVISSEASAEGEEYCMSLGAEIRGKKVDEGRLDENIASYNKMVDDAIEVLERYEDKREGLVELTKKAAEEYEKLLERIQEDQKKSRRMSMISNVIFILGIALLFIVAFLR